MNSLRVPSLLALLGGAVVGTFVRPALACGGFDEIARVRTTSETAIITYDSTTKEERFVRRASFATNPGHGASGIGFIVPTPTKPTLEEVDNGVFATLDDALQAHLDAENPSSGNDHGGAGCGSSDSALDGAGSGSRGGVEVVEETRVAGQDATVLLANDPDALTSWLDDHGFVLETSMRDYFDGYVAKGWYLTAFRYRPTGQDDRLAIKAVSMRFVSEQPFYPYREAPTAGSGQGRSLRIYTLASTALRADLGLAGERWPAGMVTWTEALSPSLRQELTPLGPLPADAVITTYDDFSDPRDGRDELWFHGDPTVTESVTAETLGGAMGSPLLLVAAVALWNQRRKRA